MQDQAQNKANREYFWKWMAWPAYSLELIPA